MKTEIATLLLFDSVHPEHRKGEFSRWIEYQRNKAYTGHTLITTFDIDYEFISKALNGLFFHYDMTWSPGLMVQRNGRVNRIGKKCLKNQVIENHYLIIPNTYDERIFAALQKRMKALNLLIPIDIESEKLFVDVDTKVARKLRFNLQPIGRTKAKN